MKTNQTEIEPKPKTLDEIASEIASEIESLSNAIQKLMAGRLKKRAIVILIRDSITPPMSLRAIEDVLDAAGNLKAHYLK